MERNHTINFLKFIAMFFIVCIHSRTVEGVNVFGLDGTTIDKVIEVCGRFAVPFFFLASGFLFTMQINTREKTFGYFLEYIKKLFLLYLSWFLIFAVYDYWKILWETGNYSLFGNEEAIAYLKSLYTKEFFIYGVKHTQYHLWFLPALIWPVIFIYFFHKLKLIDFLLIISFFLHLYGLLGQSYSFLEEIRYNTRDPFFFGLFYAVVGSFFAIHYEKVNVFARKIDWQTYAFLVTAFLFMQLGERTITNVFYDGGYEEYFLATIPLSILLFLFALGYPHIGEGTKCNLIGRNAVGVFLVHPLVVSITNVMLIEIDRQDWKENILYGVLFTPSVFLISFFIYRMIQRGKGQVLPKKPS